MFAMDGEEVRAGALALVLSKPCARLGLNAAGCLDPGCWARMPLTLLTPKRRWRASPGPLWHL